MNMLGYTKMLADLAQQLQEGFNGVNAGSLTAGLRPSRNALICAGATAAAAVAVGAAVTALRRRQHGKPKSNKMLEDEDEQDIGVNWRRVEAESDCDSDKEYEPVLSPHVNARMQQAFYMRRKPKAVPQ